MAKKSLSAEDIEKALDTSKKKEARFIIDKFNQIVKDLSSITAVDYSGNVYLKSDNTTYEKFGILDKDQYPESYYGIMYDTIELASFRKDYRFSTSTVTETSEKIIIGQTDNAVCANAYFDFIRLNKAEPNNDYLINEFYSKFFNLVTDSDLKSEFIELPDEAIVDLRDGDMIFIDNFYNGKSFHAYFTKVIFPSISKTTTLSYKIMDIINPLDEKVVYILFKEYIESIGLTVYTLIATYQSI